METTAQNAIQSAYTSYQTKEVPAWLRNSMYKDDSLILHTDLYQINMMQVYSTKRIHTKAASRSLLRPNFRLKMWLLCSAGLERIVNYLENLTFSETDIAYLRVRLSWGFSRPSSQPKTRVDYQFSTWGWFALLMNRFSKWKVPGPVSACRDVLLSSLTTKFYCDKGKASYSFCHWRMLLCWVWVIRRAQEMDAAI